MATWGDYAEFYPSKIYKANDYDGTFTLVTGNVVTVSEGESVIFVGPWHTSTQNFPLSFGDSFTFYLTPSAASLDTEVFYAAHPFLPNNLTFNDFDSLYKYSGVFYSHYSAYPTRAGKTVKAYYDSVYSTGSLPPCSAIHIYCGKMGFSFNKSDAFILAQYNERFDSDYDTYNYSWPYDSDTASFSLSKVYISSNAVSCLFDSSYLELQNDSGITRTVAASRSQDGHNWTCEFQPENGENKVKWYFVNNTLNYSTYFLNKTFKQDDPPPPPPPPPAPNPPVAYAQYPNDEILDISKSITFKWRYYSASSATQTGFIIDISSDDGGTWRTLVNTDGSDSSYTIDAYTLSNGSYKWRIWVRDENGLSSPSSLSFSCYGAPPVPSLSVEPSPFPLISWTSYEQESAELYIDDVLIPIYGNATSYRYTSLLTQGEHKAKLRIINSYSASEWAETSFVVINSPSGYITLTSSYASYNVLLNWRVSSDFLYYFVVRDDKIISRSSSLAYTDRFCAGSSIYKIIGILDEAGNYVESNIATASVFVDGTALMSIGNYNWIYFPLTSQAIPSRTISLTAEATYRHVMGCDYPVVELSRFKDKQINLSVSATNGDPICARVEALLGTVIICKTRDDIIVGALMSMNKQTDLFMTKYNIVLRKIQYNEAEL